MCTGDPALRITTTRPDSAGQAMQALISPPDIYVYIERGGGGWGERGGEREKVRERRTASGWYTRPNPSELGNANPGTTLSLSRRWRHTNAPTV